MRLTTPRWMPRFTIERLRTVVLVGGVLLVAGIAVFLAAGQWKLHKLVKDLPKRLGIDIEQQADGVNYTQSRKGKTLFKIHAARAVQMKQAGKTLLHDVRIDLYGEDGQRTDTISGSEFEYDPGAGLAQAAGAVEITLMRPGVRPAVAQLKPGSAKSDSGAKHGTAGGAGPVSSEITDNEIHVKTSGLLFDQKSGVATTAQRVDFALRQGSGNSIGATYDSAKGELILDHAVELHADRDNAQNVSEPVTVHASHAEFERSEQVCRLTQAMAEYTGGEAQTGVALIHFREGGSVLSLDGADGVDLKTRSGDHVTAARGTLDFDEHNRPRLGLLMGGAKLEMTQPNRQVEGSSPTARLTFDAQGQLSQAHLEQGVLFTTRQQITNAKGSGELKRAWKSQSADIVFAATPGNSAAARKPGSQHDEKNAHRGVEPRTIRGFGGVTITSEAKNEGVILPSKLFADTVVAELAPGGVLSSLSGTGHAVFEQTTAQGAHQTSSSDQLDVQFSPTAHFSQTTAKPSSKAPAANPSANTEIASIHQAGHVILVQDAPPARPGRAAQPPVRATASRADYDGQTQILHLWGAPRIQDGALDMTANQIDFARVTGDAFAHGDVKASWTSAGNKSSAQSSGVPGSSMLGGDSPGSNGPIHAVAAEAELHQMTGEVVFRAASAAVKTQSANQPRIWEAANSVSAPLITLNRQKQTLVAEATGPANPVRTVLVRNPSPKSDSSQTASGRAASGSGASKTRGRPDAPSVIRVRSGDLHYSEGERLALFHGGSVGSVTVETTETGGDATVVSQQAEVKLLPAGIHSASVNARAASTSNVSVDRIIATGRVVVDWPDRQGTGERLVYRGDDGTFTLTGSGAVPPRITDQARGTVTGSALIFHSGDDSVTVEGDGGKTVTNTQAPKKHTK
jgi:lipopolysaccharide export system protein LptA